MMGVIERMIRFQFSLTFTGITGWVFNTSCVRYPGSMPKLLLFCTGTLMRLATGFARHFSTHRHLRPPLASPAWQPKVPPGRWAYLVQ
jgi:hypothetical protein